MNLIAQQSAGVPPWVEPRWPLRIVRAPSGQASMSAFGKRTIEIAASSLSDAPQWYGGFSSIIVPIDLWFELPRNVREAIFRSVIQVVFIGIPQHVPRMEVIDRGLIPVEFSSNAGPVVVPWPYHDGQPRAIPAAVSWRAKSGADAVGSSTSPYLVMNRAAIFAAEERALRDPLPAFGVLIPAGGPFETHLQLPTLAEIVRDYRPAIVFALLASISIAAWLIVRRRPRIIVFALCAAVTLLALGWRQSIRPAAAQHTAVRMTMPAPGVVDIITMRSDSGPAPRMVAPAEAAAASKERVAGGAIERMGDDAEVRTSQTPPGFGDLHLPGRAWAMTWRVTKRRELGTPAAIRVRSRDAKQLVVEYDSAMPVNYVAAMWTANGKKYYGETHVRSRRGVAMIVRGEHVRPDLNFLPWQHDIWRLDTAPEDVPIALLHVERDRTTMIRHVEPRAASLPARFYTLSAPLRADGERRLSALLALPRSAEEARVLIENPAVALRYLAGGDVSAIVVSGPGGVARFIPNRTAPFDVNITAAEMQRIAPDRGVIRLDFEISALPRAPLIVQLRVRENRP